MRGSGVAREIWPTLCAVAAILDGTVEGLDFFGTLALFIMTLCMSSTVISHFTLPPTGGLTIIARRPVAAYEMTMFWAIIAWIIDTYRKTYDTSTFLTEVGN